MHLLSYIRGVINNSVPTSKLFFARSCSSISNKNDSNEYLITNYANGVKNITLNHTKTRNSLSLKMMSVLMNAINSDNDNPSVRTIVLSANGPVFSAGHNLKELVGENGPDYHKKVFKKASELMISIIKNPVPVIAMVNGLAAAAGCQLVATCDIVICSDKSTFSTPGANFGIFCSTPGIAVGRSVSKSTAMHMLLTGLPIDAKMAYDSGLVSKVVSEDQLNVEVEKVCGAIIAKSRSVIKLGKEFYYKQMAVNINEAYSLGEEIMVKNINMADGQEGINSFVQKRKPLWTSS